MERFSFVDEPLDRALETVCSFYGATKVGADIQGHTITAKLRSRNLDDAIGELLSGTSYRHEIEHSALFKMTFLTIFDLKSLDRRLSYSHDTGPASDFFLAIPEISNLGVQLKYTGTRDISAFEMDNCTLRELLDHICELGGYRWSEDKGVIYIYDCLA
ncbi:MAG: hypothetical protein QM715_06370 [Nibricoccus sp.]